MYLSLFTDSTRTKLTDITLDLLRLIDSPTSCLKKWNLLVFSWMLSVGVLATEEKSHRRDRYLVVAQKGMRLKKNALVWTGPGCFPFKAFRRSYGTTEAAHHTLLVSPRIMSNDWYHCKLSELDNKLVRLPAICETKRNGTKRNENLYFAKSVINEMKICNLRNENLYFAKTNDPPAVR